MDANPRPTWWKKAMFNSQHLNVEREYEWSLNYEDATFSRAIAQDLVMNIERNKTVRKEVPDKEVKE
tara:strand:+ start:125 stop:325 length:201 start_codon:yes stop_codon:yes gene_type:complete